MDKTRVPRTELLGKVRENREKHQITYDAAQVAYRAAVINWHQEQIQMIETGRRPDRAVPLPAPETHLRDYDVAIQMLTMSVDDTVTLTQQEFLQLVMDEWTWSRSWAGSTEVYVTS